VGTLQAAKSSLTVSKPQRDLQKALNILRKFRWFDCRHEQPDIVNLGRYDESRASLATWSVIIVFNVPYYAQSSEFTCGPACVVMVMKHFNQGIKASRRLEFEIWRQCNMIGVRGADPYGLSVPLIDAGYEVRLITKHKKVVDYDLWKRRRRRHFSADDLALSLFGMNENRQRALKRRLAVRYKRPVVEDIVQGVDDRFVPITLVHMGVVHSLNIPHWVVVIDADEELVTFNDPYPPKGRMGIKLPHAKFQRMLDDIGTRIGFSPSILLVRPK